VISGVTNLVEDIGEGDSEIKTTAAIDYLFENTRSDVLTEASTAIIKYNNQ